MSGTRFFQNHHALLIGVLIEISPWRAKQQGDQATMWDQGTMCNVVLGWRACAQSRAIRICQPSKTGRKSANSRPVTGYAEAGALRYCHFVFGAIVALLAALKLWQDSKLSDMELA